MPKHNKKLIFFIDLLEILILIKNIYTVFSNHFTYVDFNRTIQRTQFGYQPLQSYTFFFMDVTKLAKVSHLLLLFDNKLYEKSFRERNNKQFDIIDQITIFVSEF